LKKSLIILLFHFFSFGQELIFETNLPIIVIDTQNQIILDDPPIICNMGIINNTNELNRLIDPFNDYNGKINLEIRGRSSQGAPKKSYRVETALANGENNNVSLLNLPKENDWILYGPYIDKTLARNVLAYELYREMGHYSSRSRYCELFINNEYQGIYILMEKLKRDNNRIDIEKISNNDETGGYIIEINHSDSSVLSNNEYFVSFQDNSLGGGPILFEFYYPDYDDITKEQKNYIQNHIFNFEAVLTNSLYSDLEIYFDEWIDVNSAIDFFLIEELAKSIDGYRGSTFFYKDKESINNKIFFGPIWDFNLAFGISSQCDGDEYFGWTNDAPCTAGNISWFNQFNKDSIYANQVHCRWIDLRNSTLRISSIFEKIDSISNIISGSIIRNFEQWNQDISTLGYYFKIQELKIWIRNRLNWLDDNMIGSCEGLIYDKRSLIKKTDILGRNSNKKGIQLYIYNDGSVEKKYVIE